MHSDLVSSMTFKELGLRSEVLKSIEELGFSEPTPIQQKAIPHLLEEVSDFVGLAQTGTGKTAAFGLPLISKVETDHQKPQGLIICPTRELCLQISKDLESYAKHLPVKIQSVYGGTDIRKQMNAIKKGVHIIVATPGRLVDLIGRNAVQLDSVEWVVLDEADEMLNMGFKEDIDKILVKTPEWKNTWLFSATMPKEVSRIASKYMKDPLEVSVGEKNTTNENIDHIYFVVKERDRYAALKRLIDFNTSIYGLVFCRTRRETAAVAEKLERDGYNAAPLHGDLSQAQRDNVMKRFRNQSLQILVATDVAARGIDVDDITHVVHYNLPDDVENYTHRSGRTARAGKKGESLVLTNTREGHKIKAIERTIGSTFHQGFIPDAETICELQLMKLIDKTVESKVKEKDIEKFLPLILERFDGFTKEEVIKQFVSAEFNRFFDYYQKAGNLNAKADKNGSSKSSSGKKRDRSDESKTRFFVSLGTRDGLNKGGLLRVVCDETGIKSDQIGRIDIMSSYSFFDADNNYVDSILSQVNGAQFEGKKMNVEVTTKQNKGRGGKGGRSNDRNKRHKRRR